MKTILGHKGQMIMPAVAHLGTVVEIIIVVQGGGGGDGRNVAPFEQGQLLLIKIQLDDHILQYVALNGRVNTRENAFLSSHERRSEEHTSELQSRPHLVCRLLLEKKNTHSFITL